MRTSRRRLAAVTAGVAVAAVITSCGGYEPERPRDAGTTVIIAGNHSNMPRPTLPGEAKESVFEAVASGDYVYVVTASGKPQIVGQMEYGPEHEDNCNGPSTCAARWDTSVETIQQGLTAAVPTAGEVDLVAAVNLAAAQFKDKEGPKHLLIIDSGISTSGPLDYTNPQTFELDAGDHAIRIARNNGLIALDGVEGSMIGVNNVYAPQEPLSLLRKRHVTDFWEALFTELGAQVEVRQESLMADEDHAPVEGLPAVSVVSADSPEPDEADVGTDDETDDARDAPACSDGTRPPCRPDSFDANQLTFVPDTAKLRDPEAARTVLAGAAERMIDWDLSAVLSGTTALEDQSGLSKERAEAVKGVLVDLGVPESQLETEGLGVDFPCFLYSGEHGTDSWDETIAIKNRLVVVRYDGADWDCDALRD